jgi:hypothetical protein
MRHFPRVLRWKLFAPATNFSRSFCGKRSDKIWTQRAVLSSRPAIRLGLPGDFILEFRLFVREQRY